MKIIVSCSLLKFQVSPQQHPLADSAYWLDMRRIWRESCLTGCPSLLPAVKLDPVLIATGHFRLLHHHSFQAFSCRFCTLKSANASLCLQQYVRMNSSGWNKVADCRLCCYNFTNSTSMEKRGGLMWRTGPWPVLDIISIWPQAWCSSEAAVVKVEVSWWKLNSSVIAALALMTYNFNQHFDNLHLEPSFQMARQCSLGRGGCQFRGVFNPLRVWHQQEDIYFEEQSSFQAPRVTQWAWVSLTEHFLVGGMQVNTHMCSLTSKHAFPPSLPPACSPLFVLHVSATVVKEDVTVFGQSSLHHPDAAVEKALKLRGVQDLLPLFLRQLPQNRKWAWQTNINIKTCAIIESSHKYLKSFFCHLLSSCSIFSLLKQLIMTSHFSKACGDILYIYIC